jgi:hypothetical protein
MRLEMKEGEPTYTVGSDFTAGTEKTCFFRYQVIAVATGMIRHHDWSEKFSEG